MQTPECHEFVAGQSLTANAYSPKKVMIACKATSSINQLCKGLNILNKGLVASVATVYNCMQLADTVDLTITEELQFPR